MLLLIQSPKNCVIKSYLLLTCGLASTNPLPGTIFNHGDPVDKSRHSPCQCAVDCHALVSGPDVEGEGSRSGQGFTPEIRVSMGAYAYLNVLQYGLFYSLVSLLLGI